MKTRRFVISIIIMLVVTATLATGPVLAQSSAGYTLEEHTFNGGGGSASSASYTISMSSVGEGMVGTVLGSASYGLDGGFTPAYGPPTELAGLQFLDQDNLEWTADPAAASYNLYRGLISSLHELNYGNCAEQNLPSPTASDTDATPIGDGYFYLATSVNRLAEEGGKGSNSAGGSRQGAACP